MAALALGIAALAGTAPLLGALGVAAGTTTALLIGGALSGIGVALGSFIDRSFILPALFPADDIEGPRVSELRLSFADEGAPHNFAVGQEIRTSSTIIWTSDLIEVEREESQGGKGGGKGGSILSYEYYIDIALCYCKTNGQPVTLNQIIANGKEFWTSNPTGLTVGGSMTAQAPATIGGKSVWEITMATLELDQFRPGSQVAVAGFSNPNNNGSFWVISSSANAGTGTSRLRLRNNAGGSETAAGVTISQTNQPFDTAIVEDVEVYDGAVTQTPSPTIEAFEGAGSVPAWRGYAYVVLKRLFLNEFGTTAPVFNMVFEPGDGNSVSTVLTRSFALADIQGGNPITVDTSEVPDVMRGYAVAGTVDLVRMLQPLMLAYDLLAQETETGLKFFPRKRARIIDVDAQDLSTHSDGERASEHPMQVVMQSELSFPETVSVKYIDQERIYQSGQQDERARIGGADKSSVIINLPFALEAAGTDARKIAKRVLYQARAANKQVKLTLPYKYLHVQENDIIRIPDVLGETWLLLVNKIDRGDNFIITIEATVETLSVLDQEGVHESPLGIATIPAEQGGGGLAIPDDDTPPPVRDDPGTPGSGTPGTPRIAVPATLWHPKQGWRGMRIWTKLPTAPVTEYEELGTIPVEAHAGFATSAIGAGVSGFLKDGANSVTIEMLNGTLSSATYDEIVEGANVGLLTDPTNGTREIIAWETATLVDVNTWTISGLYRGLGGTEPVAQASGATFVKLTGPGISGSVFPVAHTWLGVERNFLAIPPGEDPTSAEWTDYEISFTPNSGMLRPRKVVDIVYNRDTDGTTRFRWQYVSNAISRVFGATGAPLTTPTEIYEVDVFVSGGSSVLATYRIAPGTGQPVINVTTGGEVPNLSDALFEISAPEISAILGSATAAFDVQIYQIHTGFGRGVSSGTVSVA